MNNRDNNRIRNNFKQDVYSPEARCSGKKAENMESNEPKMQIVDISLFAQVSYSLSK
jgi:hypothetical protein